MDVPITIADAESALDVHLPQSYVTFLVTHPRVDLKRDARTWTMYALSGESGDALTDTVNISGKVTLTARCLASYASDIAEALDVDSVEDSSGSPYPLARLAAGLAIGEDNGDIMFLDSSDGWSVWCFWHDGGDVERMAASFEDLLASSEMQPRPTAAPPSRYTAADMNPDAPKCPFCSEPLRTPRARQCRFCKRDWHDQMPRNE